MCVFEFREDRASEGEFRWEKLWVLCLLFFFYAAKDGSGESVASLVVLLVWLLLL